MEDKCLKLGNCYYSKCYFKMWYRSKSYALNRLFLDNFRYLHLLDLATKDTGVTGEIFESMVKYYLSCLYSFIFELRIYL